MKFSKIHLALIFMFALTLSFALPARADESKETIKFTFSAPVEIPGHALQAGTYIFERVDDMDFQDLVQVFNADHTQLLATVETVPVSRTRATDNPAITVAQEKGNPDVVVSWFYGSSLTGHQFVYHGTEEKNLTQAKRETFVGDHLAMAGQVSGE